MKSRHLRALMCGLALSAWVVPSLQAQDAAPNNRQRPGRTDRQGQRGPRTDRTSTRIPWDALLRELSLTAEQTQKVEALRRTYQTESRALRESQATPEERRTKSNELRTRTQRQLDEILTAEQRQKAREILTRERTAGPGGGLGVFNLQRFRSELNLTSEQEQKLAELRKSYTDEAAKLRESDGTPAERRQKMQDLSRRYSQQLQGILTEQQRAKLAELQARSSSRGTGGVGRGQGLLGRGLDVDRLATELKLSESQKRQAQALFDKHQKELQSLRERSQSSGADRTALREQMQRQRTEFLSALRSLLTPEQQAKLRELAPGPGARPAGRTRGAARRSQA